MLIRPWALFWKGRPQSIKYLSPHTRASTDLRRYLKLSVMTTFRSPEASVLNSIGQRKACCALEVDTPPDAIMQGQLNLLPSTVSRGYLASTHFYSALSGSICLLKRATNSWSQNLSLWLHPCMPLFTFQFYGDYIFDRDSHSKSAASYQILCRAIKVMSISAQDQHLKCQVCPLCCPGYPQLCRYPNSWQGSCQGEKLHFQLGSFTKSA
jgi:hypothetical protein